MPTLSGKNIHEKAQSLAQAWKRSDDGGMQFRQIAGEIFAAGEMNAAAEAAKKLVQNPRDMLQAIKRIAGLIPARGHLNGEPHIFRADLFAMGLYGSKAEIGQLFSSSFPQQMIHETIASGYAHPKSCIINISTPFDPELVAGVTPDEIHFLARKSFLAMIGKESDANPAWQAFADKYATPGTAGADTGECLLMGARVFAVAEGDEIEPDPLAPDLFFSMPYEKINARLPSLQKNLRERFIPIIEGLELKDVIFSLPSPVDNAVSECAVMRVSQWIRREAEILGAAVPENQLDDIHLAKNGETYLVSATSGSHLFGPVAVPVSMCGPLPAFLNLLTHGNPGAVILHESLDTFPGRGVAGPVH